MAERVENVRLNGLGLLAVLEDKRLHDKILVDVVFLNLELSGSGRRVVKLALLELKILLHVIDLS